MEQPLAICRTATHDPVGQKPASLSAMIKRVRGATPGLVSAYTRCGLLFARQRRGAVRIVFGGRTNDQLTGGNLSDGHAGQVGGGAVGGVPVEVRAGHVVADGGPGVGMPHRVLLVTERHPPDQPAVQKVLCKVRTHWARHAGGTDDPPQEAAGASTRQVLTLQRQQDRPVVPEPDGRLDRAQHRLGG